MIKDFSVSALVAGLVTVLVGVSSSAVIIFQAARALGATEAQIGSWMWALGLGIGITTVVLSLRWRIPVVTAWSTPGAAMLITAGAGVPLNQAIGAFVVCAAMMALAGFSGIFEKMIRRIPVSLASGMLAGVLLRFGLELFQGMNTRMGLVLGMIGTYLIVKRVQPRYAIVATLVMGVAVAAGQGLLKMEGLRLMAAHPVWIPPAWSWKAMVGIALPLFLVTMASQNVPGVAVMRAAGYELPVSPAIGWIGVVNVILAPFGGFALNLAAITAAICMGRDVHENPARRYIAAITAGAGYVVVGIYGATVTALFAAFPRELITAIAGLALLGSIGNGLATALGQEQHREPALISFLVTASGLTLYGIGPAFWGVVAGALALAAGRWRRQ
ncbi:MAG: benzoate/H(+) symporter BenE family transporter [Verrucomicrobiota bacterium]